MDEGEVTNRDKLTVTYKRSLTWAGQQARTVVVCFGGSMEVEITRK
jgi:hypothetical protein